jgi:flagellar biosynthetic protein FliR
MPQMQVFFVGIPLSILGGLMLLSLAIGAMMATFLGHVEGVMHELTPTSPPGAGGGG